MSAFVVILMLFMGGQFPVGFPNMEAMYDHVFSMFSYKGLSGIFVAISDTTRILLVFKQDKFSEFLLTLFFVAISVIALLR